MTFASFDDRLLEKLGSNADEISNAEITKLYLASRARLREIIRRVVRVSRGSGGIPSTGNRMFWASVLFTRLSVSAKSVEKMLPDPRPKEHWDFSAIASLVRNLVECYFVYYWLCEEDVPDDVRDARFILLYLHDHGSRRRLFNGYEVDDEEAAKAVKEDLVQRFHANPVLASLPERRQRDLIRGEKTPFIQDELLETMGVPKDEFRWLYRFLSQHTHTGPIAFYRMTDHDRGTGVETRTEKVYMIMAIELARGMLEAAVEGHLRIFPDAERRQPYLTDADVVRNVEHAQGRSGKRRSARQ